jgi:hypothetical protein
VICDDPQTDQSARSPLQTADRLSIINGAIAGLAGPGQRTAIIVPCTVIRAGDMADQLLDRQKHPDWHGERTKMVYAFPTADRLWSEYARIRAEGLRAGGVAGPRVLEGIRHLYAKDNVEKRGEGQSRIRNLRWDGGDYVPRPKPWEEE